MSDIIPPYMGRTVPQAENPQGVWLAPIKGVFHDALERWANPFEEDTFSVELESGVLWRSTTPEDRVHLTNWFDFYKGSHADQETQSVTQGADSVLSPTRPHLIADTKDFFPRLAAFIVALSLHTTAPLSGRLLLFEIEEAAERRHLPIGGYRPIETTRLPGWTLQQPITKALIAEIPATYAGVIRVFDQTSDNSLLRSLGAYRAAISSLEFMNAIPILTCASLEALTAASKTAIVLDRLANRYDSAAHGRSELEAMYMLRHWFAHGAAIPGMNDGAARVTALVEGLAIAKAVLRQALADDELFEAANAGGKAVKQLLG